MVGLGTDGTDGTDEGWVEEMGSGGIEEVGLVVVMGTIVVVVVVVVVEEEPPKRLRNVDSAIVRLRKEGTVSGNS